MQPKKEDRSLRTGLKRYFVAGILVLLPLAVTVWLVWQIIGAVEGGVQTIIERINAAIARRTGREEEFLTYHFGYGFLVVIAIVFGAGLFATNVIGRKLVRFVENLVTKVPFISKIYLTVQQIRDAFIGRKHTLFQSVAIIEYPRPGLYSVCFVTSKAEGEVQDRTKEGVVCVFVPTTPNPTSGVLVFVPEESLTPLSMTVEEAMKMVVSGGALVPPYRADALRETRAGHSEKGDKQLE